MPVPTTQTPSLRAGWYAVAILQVAYISSFIDRQILSLLVGPMKRDMLLTDTQVSLLMGLSFALFYTFLGIPFGRLADRTNRRNLIIWGISLWSLMTAVCGIVSSYTQFFLARMGVGVGEGTLSPAAYSMLADYFPKDKLATAISIYSAGVFIGSGFAMLIGAVLVGALSNAPAITLPFVGTVFAWQQIFFYVGLPGLLIAVLLLTVKEPARQGLLTPAGDAVATPTVREVLGLIGRQRAAFFSVTLGITFVSLVSYGMAAWVPTFFVRTFNWPMAQAGLVFGVIITLFATSGIIIGGRLADRFVRRGQTDGRLRVGLMAGGGTLLASFYPLLDNTVVVVAVLAVASFFNAFALGASATAIQELMPNRARSLASAIFLFVLNLIAMGFGPTSVALLTDYVFQNEGAVRYSLVIVIAVGSLLAVVCYSLGLAPYRRSIERLSRPVVAEKSL
ncbi:MFS transporter [Nibrella saemangeumensis]|uniref:MFS transporter n=1 Tax=Nibrella saemangeumensis TaxID=1084526 RepID=A0ABP8NK83_9BACT